MKGKRGSPRRILVLFLKENNDLTYIGLFLNPYHLEKYFDGKVDNSQIGRYLKRQIHTIMNYVLVEIEIGNEPVDSPEVIKKAKELALIRDKRSNLVHLDNDLIYSLSDKQIEAISKIIKDEKAE